MKVEYFKEYSYNLNKDMEFKVFGHAGKPCIAFPTQNGRASGNTEEIDLTGYTLYLDTLGKYADEALGQIELGRFETIIAYKTIE